LKNDDLFERATAKVGKWSEQSKYIRWFTDGESPYGKTLWKLASIYLKKTEYHPNFAERKLWREGLEVAMKRKGSQGNRPIKWVKLEHPLTFISPKSEVHANHQCCFKYCN